MKKSIIKVSVIVLSILIILSSFSSVFGASSKDVVGQFKGDISGSGATSAQSTMVSIISTVLNIIRTVGVAAALIILIVIACKYLIASAGERADIKKYATTYIIGALILFGASGIATIIKDFVIDNI